jgi:hypothetical protein
VRLRQHVRKCRRTRHPCLKDASDKGSQPPRPPSLHRLIRVEAQTHLAEAKVMRDAKVRHAAVLTYQPLGKCFCSCR